MLSHITPLTPYCRVSIYTATLSKKYPTLSQEKKKLRTWKGSIPNPL
jgi:hypothetical protein